MARWHGCPNPQTDTHRPHESFGLEGAETEAAEAVLQRRCCVGPLAELKRLCRRQHLFQGIFFPREGGAGAMAGG